MSIKKRTEEQLLSSEVLDAYINRPEFRYDVNGDALYRQYKDHYTQLGQKAMTDTMGQAAALTGGYGSSYAQNAGQQAYQGYMQQLGDVVPALYRLAYDRYRNEGETLYKTYQSLADQEQETANREHQDRIYALALKKYELDEQKYQDTADPNLQPAEPPGDYYAWLDYYNGHGSLPASTATENDAYDNGNVSEGNIKTIQRTLGFQETGQWTSKNQTDSGGRTADQAWEDYQRGRLQNYKSVGVGLPIGNIKTMERLLGLEEDGYWSEEDQKAAGGLTAQGAWKDYQQGKLQSRSRSGMSVDEWADLKKTQTANTPVTMTKTQQTERFVANTDSWETVARSGNGYENYEEYLKTRIDSALSKGQLTQGEAAWLISYYAPDIGESMNDQYTSDRFKQLQKQVMAQLAADVDVSYIESFLTDARAFVLQTEADIRTLTWTTDTSGQALNKRNASVQAIKDRANKVRAWLDANKSRISQDAYQQYIQYLDDLSVFLDQSAAQFKRKTAEFSRFETQEQYDQAVQEHEQTRAYQDKYTGMTANQLTAIAASLPQGKEKNWVMAYAAQMPKTKEELQQDLVWARGEYEYLTRMQNEGRKLMALKNQLAATTPDAPGYAELKKQYEDMLRQYPSMSIFEDLDGKIAAVGKKIWELERVEEYHFVNENEDFDTYSRYVSTKSDGWWDNLRSQYGMGYDDLKYEYINGAENGMRSEITEKSTTWDGTITHQFGIYDHMKPDEISTYNYYYAKYGKEQAEEYLDYITDTLEARSDSLIVQEAKKLASDHKFLSSALSVAANLATGVEFLEDIVDYGVEKMKGNPYASLGTNQAALMSSTIRSTVAEQVDWEIGNWDAFDFLYNTTMSGADSIVASTLFGKFGGIALGLSAAAQGTNDALNRGMSDGQAFWSGLLSGVFEGLFESVSIGQFSSLKEVAPESLKDIFKNLGKSMLVNASEETLTEIANIGYDTLVNGEFAHYTLEELKNGAWKDTLWQVLEAGASGLLIGTGMSMVGSTGSYVNQQARYYETGKGIVGVDGGIEALMNLANEVAGVSSAQMQSTLTSQIDKVSQKPTARNVGQLYATVQAANNQAKTSAGQSHATPQTMTNQTNTSINRADVAESLKGKGIPSQKIDTLAAAIVARVNGQKLTRTQRDVLRYELGRPSVQKVINELIQKKSNGIDNAQSAVYDDSNIRGGLTNEESTALLNLANQSVDALRNRDYATATEGSPVPQSQNTSSDGAFEGDADVTDNIITDGSHLENGKLKPNVTYKTGEHDYFYTTNEDGLIVNARTDDLQFKKHERRHKHNPNTYGKEPGDHAGHLIGDRFGGSPELDNLVSQAENVNKREYRKIEERWAKALKNGQKVTVNIDIHYDGGGVRPSSFDVTYTIDGVQHKQKIRNQ